MLRLKLARPLPRLEPRLDSVSHHGDARAEKDQHPLDDLRVLQVGVRVQGGGSVVGGKSA